MYYTIYYYYIDLPEQFSLNVSKIVYEKYGGVLTRFRQMRSYPLLAISQICTFIQADYRYINMIQ